MFGGEGGSSSQRLLEENSQQGEEKAENPGSEIGPDIPYEVETPFEGRNRLKEAIAAKDGDSVGRILDEIERRSIPFKEAAFMMTECFGELFDCYQNRMKKMLFDNVLCWPVGTARVPLDIFQNSGLERYRSWTCDVEPESLEAAPEGNQQKLTRYVENMMLSRVKNKAGLELTDAKVGCFCVENVCLPGLEGIIRPLLLKNVERSVFKSELLKWTSLKKPRFPNVQDIYLVVKYAIEGDFRFLSIRNLVYLGQYSYISYVVLIGLNSGKLRNMSASKQVWLAIAHLITCIFWGTTAKYDFIALKRQYEDYRLLFCSSDIRFFFRLAIQYETIMDALHAVLILIIIPLFHCGTYISDAFCPCLIVAIALSIFVVFEKLIRYITESTRPSASSQVRLLYIPKGILSSGFKLLFPKYLLILEVSAVLYILSNYEHKSDDRNEEEETNDEEDARTNTLVHDTFSNYWKVLFNVICALFGTFDPEVFLHSGTLSSWIIIIFVVFIFSQMVVFFNVLIAWIGQLFEENLNSIEEICIMEQAKNIDRIEASMSEMELEEFTCKIGRYLYVLYPAEDNEQEEVIWKGRVKTIVENTRVMVKKSNKAMEKRMDRLEEKVDTFQHRTNDTLEKILTKLESLKEDIKRNND